MQYNWLREQQPFFFLCCCCCLKCTDLSDAIVNVLQGHFPVSTVLEITTSGANVIRLPDVDCGSIFTSPVA